MRVISLPPAFLGLSSLAPLLAIAALGSGCGDSDLPACDEAREARARQVVFRGAEGDATPAYAGQAIMEVSCSGNGTWCHAPGARDRLGAPAGLDFHVALACTGPPPCAGSDLERLRENRDRVAAWAGDIAAEVDLGDMPPGREGRDIEEDSAETRQYGFRAEKDVDPEPLPSVRSAEGEQILRDWLACGAPVVARSIAPGDPTDADAPQPGQLCNVESEEVGDCIVEGRTEPIEATWTAIYDNILSEFCIGCHGPGERDQREDSMLDFETKAIAYEELLGPDGTGQLAEGNLCGGMETLVVPGDPEASLLVQKLEAAMSDSVSVCGSPMPASDASLTPDQIEAIAAWVADGAPDN